MRKIICKIFRHKAEKDTSTLFEFERGKTCTGKCNRCGTKLFFNYVTGRTGDDGKFLLLDNPFWVHVEMNENSNH